MRHGLFTAIAILGLMLTACQTSMRVASGALERRSAEPTVVLMPVDAQLFELTLAGLPEPKADWTTSAVANLTAALSQRLAGRQAKLVPYDAPARAAGASPSPEPSPSARELREQVIKLHEVVASTIQLHSYVAKQSLPAKRGFDWGLGEGARRLGEELGADYAVFVFLRDTYAGGARTAFIVLAAVLSQGGYIPQAGQQWGYASLVDLHTGQVVWFNRLARGVGDLRDPAGARETVEELFGGFPQ